MSVQTRRLVECWVAVCCVVLVTATPVAGEPIRQAITISKDVTKRNTGDAGASLSGYAVPIRITDPNHWVFTHGSSPQGSDIFFTSSDGVTRLPYELESYSNADGSRGLYAWVKTSLSAAEDTRIYLNFGGSESSNPTASTTWDNHYKLVQHLHNSPASTAPQMRDSTALANHGTVASGMTAANQAPGQFDGALAFNGTSTQYVTVAGNSSLEITNTLTVEGWMNPAALDGGLHAIVGYSDSEQKGYKLAWDNRVPKGGTVQNNMIWFSANDNHLNASNQPAAWNTLQAACNVQANQWYYVVATFSPGKMEILLNGTSLRTLTPSSVLGAYDSSPVYVGRWGGTFYFNGLLDEIRISDTVRDPATFLANYRLMTSPDQYLAFGSYEVPEPATLALAAIGGLGLLGWRRRGRLISA